MAETRVEDPHGDVREGIEYWELLQYLQKFEYPQVQSHGVSVYKKENSLLPIGESL
jgi:hypothetical protein